MLLQLLSRNRFSKRSSTEVRSLTPSRIRRASSGRGSRGAGASGSPFTGDDAATIDRREIDRLAVEILKPPHLEQIDLQTAAEQTEQRPRLQFFAVSPPQSQLAREQGFLTFAGTDRPRSRPSSGPERRSESTPAGRSRASGHVRDSARSESGRDRRHRRALRPPLPRKRRRAERILRLVPTRAFCDGVNFRNHATLARATRLRSEALRPEGAPSGIPKARARAPAPEPRGFSPSGCDGHGRSRTRPTP